MSKFLNRYISLTIFILFFSCDSNNSSKIIVNEKIKSSKQSDSEEFESFCHKFYGDSMFQLSRIKFPLPGINTDDMDIGGNSIYYWQKSTWQILSNENLDTNIFNVKYIEKRNKIVEEITSKEDPGLIIKLEFTKLKGHWFLTRFEDINL